MTNNSIEKNSILVSRNTPIALVVGVAGFLGSNLADGLLSKGIQVVGIDNFTTGKKDNLNSCAKDKDFHLINQNAEDLNLGLPRLDYIFITAGANWNLSKVMNLAKKFSSKLVFLSSIELYDKETEEDLAWYRHTESEIAKFASENKLNARILRLAGVYGPRMNFKLHDPLVKLIHYAVTNRLQKHTTLEFSSRAIFIDDAVSLIIKSMLAGSTSMKIFDGSLLTPVKIAEVNQVLMDPNWYEHRSFEPSELPPWPTPNLEKTIKFLSWEPKANLVKALKLTVEYFKEFPAERTEDISEYREIPYTRLAKNDFTIAGGTETESENKRVTKDDKKREDQPVVKKSKFTFSIFFTLVAVGLIGYGLIWPATVLGWNIYTIKSSLAKAIVKFYDGDFNGSTEEIKKAKQGIVDINDSVVLAGFVGKINIAKISEIYKMADELVYITDQSISSTQYSIAGFNNLILGLKATTGELNEDPSKYFQQAEEQFATADGGLSKISALIEKDKINENLPSVLKQEFENNQKNFNQFNALSQKGRVMAAILPKLFAQNGKKNYLMLLQNNNELRPTGGFISSFAKVEFEDGKLKKLATDDIYNLDSQLNMHVDPPKEIKDDLGQKDFFLRDSNWESDFPTSARQAAWFYAKETGLRVDGVIALDLSALEDLLKVTGAVGVTEFSENINADNLFEKSMAHLEQGFITGSNSKKNFVTVLSDRIFNKVFFLPNQNWAKIVSSLANSIETKHLMFYIDDPKIFSYFTSVGWVGALPRPSEKIAEGLSEDMLAVVEANLGANKTNYFLDRSYALETLISKNDDVSHKLKITYTNRSPSGIWPGGNYKNRLRVYLPIGSKLIRATFGGADITKSTTAFSDYGRTGYSMLIEVKPKENKNLILEYQLGTKLNFKNGKTSYRLDIIKQAGTGKDAFEWKINYPRNYTLDSSLDQKSNPQEYAISTDLSRDRRLEIIFNK